MINEIFDKYGSDKGTNGHGYGPFYEQWLPDNPKKILEIGVNKGASIRAWREIFPNAEVHGLDLFVLDPIPADIPGAIFWQGNQTDQYMLTQLRNQNFDLIIDDGSHNTRDQLVTFFSLIQSNCVYIIEDLHCQFNPFFNTGVPEQFWPSRILDMDTVRVVFWPELNPKIMATSCKQWK